MHYLFRNPLKTCSLFRRSHAYTKKERKRKRIWLLVLFPFVYNGKMYIFEKQSKLDNVRNQQGN